MDNRPQTSKINELRERTDRQLIAFIDRRLDVGLRSYGPAAEKIYLEVAPLMLVANAAPGERSRLESKLERLEATFNAMCASR